MDVLSLKSSFRSFLILHVLCYLSERFRYHALWQEGSDAGISDSGELSNGLPEYFPSFKTFMMMKSLMCQPL